MQDSQGEILKPPENPPTTPKRFIAYASGGESYNSSLRLEHITYPIYRGDTFKAEKDWPFEIAIRDWALFPTPDNCEALGRIFDRYPDVQTQLRKNIKAEYGNTLTVYRTQPDWNNTIEGKEYINVTLSPEFVRGWANHSGLAGLFYKNRGTLPPYRVIKIEVPIDTVVGFGNTHQSELILRVSSLKNVSTQQLSDDDLKREINDKLNAMLKGIVPAPDPPTPTNPDNKSEW